MADNKRPDWQVRILEHVENMQAVRGKPYADKLLLWTRVLLQLAAHTPGVDSVESREILFELARALELDDKDVIAMGDLAARSRNEALRGGRAGR